VKSFIQIIILLMAVNSHAQIKFSGLINLGQLPYKCLELDGLTSYKNQTIQLLTAINYTSATINKNLRRSTEKIDDRFEKTGKEKIIGPGYGVQLRIKLNHGTSSNPLDIYAAFGINKYFYKGHYFINEYVYSAPFYHFTLNKYSYRFTKTALSAQFSLVYRFERACFEFSGGFNQTDNNLNKEVSKNRNLNLNMMDYGYVGIAPVFNLRIGYNFYTNSKKISSE
jgi:hypothetical protein